MMIIINIYSHSKRVVFLVKILGGTVAPFIKKSAVVQESVWSSCYTSAFLHCVDDGMSYPGMIRNILVCLSLALVCS